MRSEASATQSAIRIVRDRLDGAPGRTVLVRSVPGGGASLVVADLARTSLALRTVEDVDALDEAALLELRREARSAPLVLASERARPAPPVRALLEYLGPQVVEVDLLGLDQVHELLDATLDQPVDDVDAARIRRWTGGRLGDVLDVARHLATTVDPAAPLPARLTGFAPSARRVRSWPGERADWIPWALVTAAGATGLGFDQPDPTDPVRPVDAAAILGELTGAERRAAIEQVLDRAASIPGAELTHETVLEVGSWWCEADRTTFEAAELGHLVAAVQTAFVRNRLDDALPMAERLWRRTSVPLAGVALASALARAAPTEANRALADELAASASSSVRDAAVATRATWRFHHDGRGDEAVAALRAHLGAAAPGDDVEATRSTLATLELHLGRPDDAEAVLGTDIDREGSTGGPTSFSVNALVLADLARGRHQRAVDRLDAELEHRLDPGPNLTVDRYRFLRTVASAQAGWDDADATAELDRAYVLALDGGDDWSIGWMGWGAGVHAARSGRFVTADRRLRTATAAFVRAHRPGFAMWPTAALVDVHALADLSGVAHPQPVPPIPFDHAVLAERAAAELALAHVALVTDRPAHEVAAALARAMATAEATGDVVAASLVAIEQVLAGLDATAPDVDPLADGVLVEVRPGRSDPAARTAPALVDAGRRLAERGWVVLGVRLLAAGASVLNPSDPRAAGRILQEVRSTTATFEAPLRPWALGASDLPDLPTLSSREREVAEAVAAGASRDEVAAALVVSRRTVDSHLQRVYAKLGISSRSELRAWLDRA